ncbi:MAG: hypothetical protein WBD56_11595, partial [Anaerolineales bacterium]
GETMMSRAKYAMLELNEIQGIKTPLFTSHHFHEFVINFDQTGKNIMEINRALLEYKIFGGADLSSQFPELGQSALYCVTEVHTKTAIDRLVKALKEVITK